MREKGRTETEILGIFLGMAVSGDSKEHLKHRYTLWGECVVVSHIGVRESLGIILHILQ